jgi:asparagine synthetase B (glutamine-hydrolysing)
MTSVDHAAAGLMQKWITSDEPTAQNRYIDTANQIILTTSVTLDNCDQIIEQLGVPRSIHRHPPDDLQLLISAYQTWGASFVERLVGDFAFC